MKHIIPDIGNKSSTNINYFYFNITISLLMTVFVSSLGRWLYTSCPIMNNWHNDSSSQILPLTNQYSWQIFSLTPLLLSTTIAYQSKNSLWLLYHSGLWFMTSSYAQEFPAPINDNVFLSSKSGVLLQGGASRDETGWSASSAGDVNGDGMSDFLIGAYKASPGGRSNAGVTYLIYGANNLSARINLGNLTAEQGVILQGGATSDWAGYSLASAGDVNNDGLSDFLIGAVGDMSTMKSGSVYLIYGAINLPRVINLSNLTAQLGVVFQGGAVRDEAGYSVSGAGDVNGDGKSDFLIGARLVDPAGRNNAGAVYLIYGTTSLPATVNLGNLPAGLGVILQGGAASYFVGNCIAGAGDVNADGKSDFLIGASEAYPGGQTQAGMAYLIYGKANLSAIINLGTLTSTQGVVFQGGRAGDWAGTSVASAGDVNADGKSDFLIGSVGADPAGTSSGAAYLIYGAINLPATINLLSRLTAGLGVVFQGGAAYNNVGSTLARTDDINGDGRGDFLIGQAKVAYLIYGAANFAETINLGNLSSGLGVIFQGDTSSYFGGRAIASPGDINGDGNSDFLFGDFQAGLDGQYLAGAAYVVYGQSSNRTSVTAPLLTPLSSTLNSLLTSKSVTSVTTAPMSLTPTSKTSVTTTARTMVTTSKTITTISKTTTNLAKTKTLVTTQSLSSQNSLLTSQESSITSSKAVSEDTRSSQSNTPPTLTSEDSRATPLSSNDLVTSISDTFTAATRQLTVLSSTSPTTNDVPIIAAVSVISLTACLAAGIGIYAYRKKIYTQQSVHSEDSVMGTALQYKQPSNYQQLPTGKSAPAFDYSKVDEFKAEVRQYDNTPPVIADDLKSMHV